MPMLTGFLYWDLQSMRFCKKWICWNKRCIHSAHFSVLVGGESKGFFNSSRGLRKSDPLLPFCFSLVMEVLSLMINMSRERFAEAIQVRNDGTPVTHLQFAGDTLFIADGDKEQI